MRTYELVLDDDRYSAPLTVYLAARTAGRARAFAAAILLRSPHHLRVAAFAGYEHLFTLGEPRLARSHRDAGSGVGVAPRFRSLLRGG